MTPADFTLSTPGANLLSVLPPRRRTGARVEPFISGVTAVEHKTRLRSRNIRAVHMKEDKKPFLLFLEGERERGSYGGRGKAWAGPTYPDRTS